MKINKLTLNQKYLRRRILELSHELHTSHIGSCVSAIDLIDVIYEVKKNNEKFILSNGHSGVALYVILEKIGMLEKPSLNKFHVHPDRNAQLGIDVSTGSLGQGLPIAVGMALAEREKKVFVMLSDGECAEGSIWEALRIADDSELSNLYIVINANGWGAYDAISIPSLVRRFKGFVSSGQVSTINGHNREQILKALKTDNNCSPRIIIAKTSSDQFPFLKGLDAHYYVMTDDDYKEGMEILKG